MKHYLRPVLFVVLLTAVVFTIEANAQTASAETHLAAARAAAYRPGFDFTYVFDSMCEAPEPGAALAQINAPQRPRTIPPRGEWYVEPAKVFDNLYFVGSRNESAWAVTTSEGIILIDSTQDYTVETVVAGGLKKLGLDPAQIKYVILGHPHGAPSYGAKFLQDTYRPRIIMSEADWNVVAKNTVPANLKPRKDMVATDGMKLTLGDTTVTIHVTPGHTPGTLSTLVPLKDGNQRHLGYILGGMGADVGRDGVQYWADEAEALRTWTASNKRFHDLAMKAGADVFLSIHPHHDKTFEKINAIRFRAPGTPHPFVGKEAISRHVTVMTECMAAQLAWLANPRRSN
jgi:metallo-beta-lactamase class B